MIHNLFDPKLYAHIYASACLQNGQNMDVSEFRKVDMPILPAGKKVLVTFEIVDDEPLEFSTNLQFVQVSA